jgi:uncharacterized protein
MMFLMIEGALAAKVERLSTSLEAYGSVVVAYSGGVDSSVLMARAHEVLGHRAVAITAVSPSLARRELEDAKRLARAHGWQHRLVRTGEVTMEAYARNDSDRCYWCKSALFDVLDPLARKLQAVVALGTNTDDLVDHRPGLRAAAERGAAAPLLEAELSKQEVRSLARSWRLPVADKPAAPCLSSRFAYGVRVTAPGLRRIEAAEEAIRSHGFEVLRVRDLGEDRARVEIDRSELDRARASWQVMQRDVLAVGFEEVALDPDGFRSGAMNALVAAPTIR